MVPWVPLSSEWKVTCPGTSRITGLTLSGCGQEKTMCDQDQCKLSSLRLMDAILNQEEFKFLKELIHSECGIKLVPGKKTMLEGRLRKRLRALGMDSFGAYCDYLSTPGGMQSERIHMIDVVTTNKTDFFREPDHFEYLLGALPQIAASGEAASRMKLRVWSAGCSTGEEPYTLAMVLSEFARTQPGFRFSILATDIATTVLEAARKGIYSHDRVEPVPIGLRKKYLLKSKDKSKGLVRIVPELRAQVTFQRLNFMDSDYGIRQPIDIVFCRNVLIYFDRKTQERVLRKFCNHLVPGGYLFTGHSETLQNMKLPVSQVSASIYRRL